IAYTTKDTSEASDLLAGNADETKRAAEQISLTIQNIAESGDRLAKQADKLKEQSDNVKSIALSLKQTALSNLDQAKAAEHIARMLGYAPRQNQVHALVGEEEGRRAAGAVARVGHFASSNDLSVLHVGNQIALAVAHVRGHVSVSQWDGDAHRLVLLTDSLAGATANPRQSYPIVCPPGGDKGHRARTNRP
ncbi:MAG: hypothetical protein LOD90_07465, partial [Symbiobacteriaceae bacterium]